MNTALLHIAESVVFHIPQASTVWPPSVDFLLGDEDLAHEANDITDHNTHQLFELFKLQWIVFPVSLLEADPKEVFGLNMSIWFMPVKAKAQWKRGLEEMRPLTHPSGKIESK